VGAVRVVHALRLKGFADAPSLLGAAGGLDEHAVVHALDDAQREGLVTRRDGIVSGWALTPAGRARDRQAIDEELARTGARDKVEDAYRRFVALNGELLQVCTDWQLLHGDPGTLNHHRDAAYDATVVARLRAVDDAVQPVCADLAAALARFATYGPRLGAALRRVERGEHDWFVKPMIDSYHTVWFELHEDLLMTLGLERSKEGTR
jgi:hypothetical protein